MRYTTARETIGRKEIKKFRQTEPRYFKQHGNDMTWLQEHRNLVKVQYI